MTERLVIPDIEAFEERAAICQYEGQITRKQAEDFAARLQGFRDADHYFEWLTTYVLKRGLS
jgi:hypothetical protein